MSPRLWLLNQYLRFITKPKLERTTSPMTMRRDLATLARRLPKPPEDARFASDVFEIEGGPRGKARRIQAEWCDWGASDPTRVVLYLHGGAFICGSAETHRSLIWPLARASGSRIVAINYRRAPEHPFPAAFEDALAVWEALTASRFAPERTAIAGDSAGAGLGAALAAEADRRGGPRPACLVGFSGFFDLTLSSASLRRFARRDVMLPVSRMQEAVDGYLAGAEATDPRASALFAPITKPIPTLLQVGATEALRDDSMRYSEALRAAGGDVRVEVWKGAPHAFAFFAPFVRESAEAVESAGRFIRRHQGAGEGGARAAA